MIEEKVTESLQPRIEGKKKELRSRPLPLEVSDQISLWSNNTPPLSFLNPGHEEDTIYLDTNTNLKVFKFNHHTNQFSFERIFPKKVSQGIQPIYSQNTLVFCNNAEKTITSLSNPNSSIKFTRLDAIFMNKYSYKNILKNQPESILVEQVRINKFYGNKMPEMTSFQLIETQVGWISAQNLIYVRYGYGLKEEVGIFCISKKDSQSHIFKDYLNISGNKKINKFLKKQLEEDCKGFSRRLINTFKLTRTKNLYSKQHATSQLTQKTNRNSTKAFFTTDFIHKMFVVTSVNLRTKKILRKVGVSFFEILNKLNLLKNRNIRKVRYLIEPVYYEAQDTLYLYFEYEFKKKTNGGYNALDDTRIQALVKNFTQKHKRTIFRLQKNIAEKDLEIFQVGKRELLLSFGNKLFNRGLPHNSGRVSGKRPNIEHDQISQNKIRFDNFRVLKKDEQRCLAATENHLISMKLDNCEILSKIRFSDFFAGFRDKAAISVSLGARDLLCSLDHNEIGVLGHKYIDIFEISDKNVRKMAKIDLKSYIKSIKKFNLERLLGVEAVEETNKILILAQLSYGKPIAEGRKNGELMAEVEINLDNVDQIKVELIEKKVQRDLTGQNIQRKLVSQRCINQAQFINNLWVVPDCLMKKDSKKFFFTLDVFDSTSKRHVKSTVFPVMKALKDYKFYSEKTLKRSKSLFYLIQEQEGRLRNRREVQFFIQKYEISNLLNVEQESEFELSGWVTEDPQHQSVEYLFNPLAPELAVNRVSDGLERADYDTQRVPRKRRLVFYDENIQPKHEMAVPLYDFRLEKSQFEWIGEERCCLEFQPERHSLGPSVRPDISHRVLGLDLEGDKMCVINFGEGDRSRYFSNTALSIIYASKNWVLFSHHFSDSGNSMLISDKVNIVDLRGLSLINK